MESNKAGSDFPRPFYTEGFSRSRQQAAQALWNWHSHLQGADAPALDGEDLQAFFLAERKKVSAGKPVRVVPELVWQEAYEVCEIHALPASLLAVQAEAARHFLEPMRFTTYEELQAFMYQWVAPHARLLAQLGGLNEKWQTNHIDAFGQGLFLIGRLAQVPADAKQNRIYLPLEDLRRAGIGEEQVLAGQIDEPMRGVLWKFSVRARDALAHSRDLLHDLRWRQRGPFKRAWLGGLEILGEIERRDFDVWSSPVSITWVSKMRIRLQSIFGKSAFGRR